MECKRKYDQIFDCPTLKILFWKTLSDKLMLG